MSPELSFAGFVPFESGERNAYNHFGNATFPEVFLILLCCVAVLAWLFKKRR